MIPALAVPTNLRGGGYSRLGKQAVQVIDRAIDRAMKLGRRLDDEQKQVHKILLW
jgi:hypothetical protein